MSSMVAPTGSYLGMPPFLELELSSDHTGDKAAKWVLPFRSFFLLSMVGDWEFKKIQNGSSNPLATSTEIVLQGVTTLSLSTTGIDCPLHHYKIIVQGKPFERKVRKGYDLIKRCVGVERAGSITLGIWWHSSTHVSDRSFPNRCSHNLKKNL